LEVTADRSSESQLREQVERQVLEVELELQGNQSNTSYKLKIISVKRKSFREGE
jgi:hypothetical protein